MTDQEKKEILKDGCKVTAIVEAVCLPSLSGKALEFTQMHVRCKDWFGHPDWDEYAAIIAKCKRIMEG